MKEVKKRQTGRMLIQNVLYYITQNRKQGRLDFQGHIMVSVCMVDQWLSLQSRFSSNMKKEIECLMISNGQVKKKKNYKSKHGMRGGGGRTTETSRIVRLEQSGTYYPTRDQNRISGIRMLYEIDGTNLSRRERQNSLSPKVFHLDIWIQPTPVGRNDERRQGLDPGQLKASDQEVTDNLKKVINQLENLIKRKV